MVSKLREFKGGGSCLLAKWFSGRRGGKGRWRKRRKYALQYTVAIYFNFKNKNEKLNMHLVYDLAVMFLGFYPREMKTYIHTNFIRKCTEQLYLQEPQTRNSSYVLKWNKCINKLWHIPTIGYYSAKKRKQLLIRSTTWMGLQRCMLSEKSKSQ